MGQCFCIALRGQETCFTVDDRLHYSVGSKADHRKTHGLGLCEHVGIALGIAGYRADARSSEYSGAIHPMFDLIRRLETQETITTESVASELLQLLPQRTIADHYQLYVRHRRLHLRHCSDRILAPFFFH